MAKILLNAEKRDTTKKTKELRANRIVPAVVYGKHQESTPIQLDASDVLRVFREAGESNIVNLKIKGIKDEIEVLFHELQYEPVTWDIIHVDFYALTRWEKLTTKIPLEFVGDSEALKEWAILSENVKELEVSCLPKDLVDSFKVDLSLLKEIEDIIKLKDLNIDTTKFEVHHLHDDDAIAVANKSKKETVSEESTEISENSEETK